MEATVTINLLSGRPPCAERINMLSVLASPRLSENIARMMVELMVPQPDLVFFGHSNFGSSQDAYIKTLFSHHSWAGADGVWHHI